MWVPSPRSTSPSLWTYPIDIIRSLKKEWLVWTFVEERKFLFYCFYFFTSAIFVTTKLMPAWSADIISDFFNGIVTLVPDTKDTVSTHHVTSCATIFTSSRLDCCFTPEVAIDLRLLAAAQRESFFIPLRHLLLPSNLATGHWYRSHLHLINNCNLILRSHTIIYPITILTQIQWPTHTTILHHI